MQHNLRKEVDALGTVLAFVNIALVPILVAGVALLLAALRRRRRAPARWSEAATMAMTADPRRRNLGYLAGAAIVSIVLALFALWQQSSRAGRAEPPRAANSSPASPREVRKIARIHIVSKKGAFDVVFRPTRAGSSHPG